MLLVAKDIEASYDGKVNALAGISFGLEKGEILAILGPNGSGKTTLFRLLLGFMSPRSGTLEVLGKAPGAMLASIGATIEIPSLYPHLDARENLEITAELKGVTAPFDALIAEVGLADAKRMTVAMYSLGMKQRLAIANALIGDPKLLILDEPTNGLDPEGIRWFREWLRDAVKARDVSVILSSHILTEVAAVADRLLVMKKGRERFSGTVADLEGPTATRVRTAKPDASEARLREKGFSCDRVDDALHVQAPAPEVARLLAEHDLLELGPLSADLESRYLAIVGDS